MQSFGLDAGLESFCYSFTALWIIRCLKSARKFTVQMCHIATVIMETMQLILSKF